MKTSFLFILIISSILRSYSQDIILTLDGVIEETSVNAPLDMVIIENLTSGESKELFGSYIFNLTSGISLRIGDLETGITQKGFQKVFPNPFSSLLNIEFYSEGVGTSDVSIYNIEGKKIVTFSKDVVKGTHRLVFSPNADGLYFIQLIDNGNSYHSKVIASQNHSGGPTLRYSSMSESLSTKSEKKFIKGGGPFYTIGNVLRYTGHFGSQINTIYASPTQSNTVTFNFSAPYFRFEPYLLEANIPCFVDIMFSVTDANNRGVDYLTNSDFNVLEDGTTISPTETFRYVKKLDQVPFFQKTVIMLDNSSSVAANLTQIKTAAILLVNKLVADQEIAIYSFSDNAILLQDFTKNISDLENAINSITAGFPSTNLYGSLITGLNSFTNIYSLDVIEEGYLIALTDGDDTQGSSTLQQVLDTRSNKRAFIVGLGTELDPNPLIQIASTGKYFPVTSVAQLEANFKQMRLDIIQYSNSFYWLNYMSPKRNGIHNLTVEAIGNTNTNSDSYLQGSFPTDGFQSVYSGVYANITSDKLYGVDWVNLADDNYAGNLKATTYWATDVPVYTWSNDNPSIVTTNVNPFDNSKMTLSSWSAASSEVATITLIDIANNFSKEIDVFSNAAWPSVYTKGITAITNSSATISGLAVPGKNNNPTIMERGINLGFSQFRFNSIIKEDFGAGKYSIVATNLIANTTYYSRAYIQTSDNQYSYSSVVKSFTTLPGLPYLTHIQDYNYTTGKKSRTSAYLNSIIANDGGNPLTEKGFVYSTNPNPTLATASQITNMDALDANGRFESNIVGLTPDIDYYARGYATNSYGTTYSYEIKFKTAPIRVPYLPNINERDITQTSMEIDGSIIYDGGSITDKGVCWSTITNPTIALSTKTSEGLGNGNFTSLLTGLQPSTIYYVRAFATNTTGTGYSDEKTIITEPLDCGTVTDYDNNVYKTASIGTQCWMREDLAVSHYRNGDVIPQVADQTEWQNLTTGAWCYYENGTGNGAKLYNWHAVNDPRGLAPVDWHVPSITELETMINFLSSKEYAGGQMKSISAWWRSPNEGASNRSGFTGLPRGGRFTGGFGGIGYYGHWWTSTGYGVNPTDAYRFTLSYSSRWLEVPRGNLVQGLSVRCIKD